MYYQKKLVYKIIPLVLCLIIVSACEGSIDVSKGSIDEKKDIEMLTEEKNTVISKNLLPKMHKMKKRGLL